MRKIWNFSLNLLGIGEKKPEPEEMSVAAVKVLIFFSVALGIILLVSNLAALKIWRLSIPWPVGLFPIKEWRTMMTIPVDAGIWLFPLSYIIGDLLINTYGEKLANLVAVYSAAFAVVVVAIFGFARYALPDFPGVDNGAFNIMQSAMGRVFLASVAGFLAGQIVNNYYFTLFREFQTRTKATDTSRGFRERALISSVIAHIVDSLIFETLAFWGKVSAEDFVKQITLAFIAAFGIEALLGWKLTPWMAMKLERKLRYSDGKRK